MTTPSGNIACRFVQNYVRCEIREFDFVAPALPETCGTPMNDGFTFEVRDEAGPTCAGPSIVETAQLSNEATAWHKGTASVIPGSSDAYASLRYGEALQVEGTHQCGSGENGVTCENLNTGHGSRLSRAAFSIF